MASSIITHGETYIDEKTGQAWIFWDGMWRRAEHPFIQRLRQRGGIQVDVDGQRHEVRLMIFRDVNSPDVETLGLSLSEVNVLLNADKEV